MEKKIRKITAVNRAGVDKYTWTAGIGFDEIPLWILEAARKELPDCNFIIDYF